MLWLLELRHVGYIKQAGGGASVEVLLQDSFWILYWHLPATERNHLSLRTVSVLDRYAVNLKFKMQVVQLSFLQGLILIRSVEIKTIPQIDLKPILLAN